MNTNEKKSNPLLNLLFGTIIFVVLMYIIFGVLTFSVQQAQIQNNADYMQKRFIQLQSNLEVLEEVYVKAYGEEDERTIEVRDLLAEAPTVTTYEELEQYISQVDLLRENITYSSESSKHLQRVLHFVLFVNSKTNAGLEEIYMRFRSYEGASRILPGMQYIYPIETEQIK